MQADPFRQLLRSADATASRPATTGDLVASVRRRHARRRRFRHGAIACAVALLVASLPIAFRANRSKPNANAQEFAALSIEADLHELTASTLMAGLAHPADSKISEPAIPDVQLQRDRAALIMVYQANQHLSGQRADLAIVGYRRTIDLFPQTHWADVARQRLRELRT